MKIAGVAFVGHPVASLRNARQFYETVLQLAEPRVIEGSLDGDRGFLEYTIGSFTLAITTTWSGGKPPETPSAGLVFEVADFDDAVRHIQACGVTFELGPFEMANCHVAVFKDPDGNTIGIHKLKSAPTA